ncbi:MAG: DUF4368 domain-containing protein [Clostridia bacterium]|nr:DUF4368 domain-containing protein [Clostridia bacterium]
MCDHKGLGLSQQARFGESGFDPDRNTARQVLEPSIETLLASYRGDNGSERKSAYSCEYDLKAEAKVLRQEIETQEQQNQNLEQFIQKVRKYAELTELTPYAAHELIKTIYVGAPDKSSGKRRQSIHICYDLIGFISMSELMTQEMA